MSSLLQHITLTGYEPNEDREFPRLNNQTIIIWKIRVTVALESKNLLGFVERIDYTGDSDFCFDSDEKLNPALSDIVEYHHLSDPSQIRNPPPLETTAMWTSGKKTPAIHCL
ncbi:Hypothetical protein PHPALM_16960 [Phytophthora palmivora]|uniref:Uncharacterized protein n=1 Tax=Phytophthora palmivora TaxID=4796 RepID=A0A2P4XNH6_9STRA|nr:Hypothetical protein PHPALM_16960 [Phytophthora palmivora]